MDSNYRKIEFGFGNLESAVEELKSHEDLVCGSFNGTMLYSDIDDMESAYKKVMGKTKAESDEAARQWKIEYDRKKQEHREAIPRLTEEWITKGNNILDEKHHEYWAKIVPVRLGDLYEGMELEATLDIIEKLNNGCELELAKETIVNQGHSGMSFSLVCSMVKRFCDRGDEFVKYVNQ